MNKRPHNLVSIVIPSYNRAWCLPAAVESALTQTYPDLEILVVDNCSTDETPDVVSSYQDPRLHYHRQPYNIGMAPNWTDGLRRASGRYVAFLCDDDRLRPDFVAHRLPQLIQDDRVAAVFSRYDVQDRAGHHLITHNLDRQMLELLHDLDFLDAALDKRWFIGATLYRKNAVEAVWARGERDNLVLDFGLNIRLALTPEARGVYLPDNDFIMMSHEQQNSTARLWTVLSEVDALLERILREEAITSAQALRIRRELANWNVLWGRKLAEQRDVHQARRRFYRALRIDPGLAWAWKQMAKTWLCPQRFAQSA